MTIFSFFPTLDNRLVLDARLFSDPSTALAQAQAVAECIIKDILKLAAHVGPLPTTYHKGSGMATKAEGMCHNIDNQLYQLTEYLYNLTDCPLSVVDSYALQQLLQSTDELKQISIHLTHTAILSRSISKQKQPLSFAAQREIAELWNRIDTLLKKLDEAFLKGNSITSMWMLMKNTMIQEQIKDVKKNHIRRLRNGKCSVETGLCFLELLFDYEQIAIHCTNLFDEAYIMDNLEERKG